MGLDWAELVLAVEEEHGVAIDWDQLSAVAQERHPPDITVSEFHQHINIDSFRVCGACRYLLRGLPSLGICPECGQSYSSQDVTLQRVIELIGEFLAINQNDITPNMLMNKDLGMD